MTDKKNTTQGQKAPQQQQQASSGQTGLQHRYAAIGIEAVAAAHPDLALVTPAHQCPTGVVLAAGGFGSLVYGLSEIGTGDVTGPILIVVAGILLIVAAVGALTLTHRQRIRARLSQRAVAAGKMQDYAAKGAHPGQKPMPGVYASTNSAAAPALDAQGEAVEESVPRVLRARGQGLELSDVSPEMGLAQRSGTIVSRLAGADQAGAGDSTRGPRDARRSGMPSMPGAAAPAVKQPVLSDDDAVDSAAPEQKEEK